MTSKRRFDLKSCDLPTMLWNINNFLRILTLNIDNRNKKPIPTMYYISTLVAVGCYFYVYSVSMIWFVFWKCAETGDLVAASIVLSLGIPSEIGTVKLIYMFIYQNKLRRIVSRYLAFDSDRKIGARFKRNLMESLKSVKRRTVIYWTVLMMNAVIYIARPIFTPGRHLSQNVIIIYGLEPMFESPNYEIASMMMAIGVFFVCYTPTCITGFLIITVGYTECQILSLSDEMLHIWTDAIDHFHSVTRKNHLKTIVVNNKVKIHYLSSIDINKLKDKIVNDYIKDRIKVLIRKHTINIALVREIEEVFRVPIAVGFLLLILGLITELLGGLENTNLQVPFAIIQVAMDCYVGQNLMDANVAFEQTVYNCHWERFDITNQKIILVMLQNSQKTLTMSAGGFVTLSFGCLMSVFKSIYSSYTALRSIVKNTSNHFHHHNHHYNQYANTM